MRERCAEIFKSVCRRRFLADRVALGINQTDMARRLVMSARSYNDIETGKGTCSAVTLALYLVRVCPDVNAFIEEMRAALDKELVGTK